MIAFSSCHPALTRTDNNGLHNRSQLRFGLAPAQSQLQSQSLSVPVPVPVPVPVTLVSSLSSSSLRFPPVARPVFHSLFQVFQFTSFASELRHLRQTINATRHLKAARNVRQGRAKAINLSSLSKRQHPQHTLCRRQHHILTPYYSIYACISYI